MNRKDTLKSIELMLQEGKSRQEIFTALSSKVKYRSDLIQYIAMVPTYENRLKYKILNLILFVLIILVTILTFRIGIIYMYTLSLYVLPIVFIVAFIGHYYPVMIYNYRWNMYRVVGLLGIAGICNSASRLMTIFTSHSYIDIVIKILVGYLSSVLIIYLAFYIGSKVFPYYSFWGQLKEDKLHLGS